MECLEYSNCLSFHGFLLLPLLEKPRGDVFFQMNRAEKLSSTENWVGWGKPLQFKFKTRWVERSYLVQIGINLLILLSIPFI